MNSLLVGVRQAELLDPTHLQLEPLTSTNDAMKCVSFLGAIAKDISQVVFSILTPNP